MEMIKGFLYNNNILINITKNKQYKPNKYIISFINIDYKYSYFNA